MYTLNRTEFNWDYFWTVWKSCAIHGNIHCPHIALDHLELFEFVDQKVKRIPNVLFAKSTKP